MMMKKVQTACQCDSHMDAEKTQAQKTLNIAIKYGVITLIC